MATKEGNDNAGVSRNVGQTARGQAHDTVHTAECIT